MKNISTESMIYDNFIVGFSTCNRKKNDQDYEGNTKKDKKNRTIFKHFQNNRLLNFFHFKYSLKKNNHNFSEKMLPPTPNGPPQKPVDSYPCTYNYGFFVLFFLNALDNPSRY